MKITQALQLLAKVKACWYRQPADDRTAEEWAACFLPVEYRDAESVINDWRDRGEAGPPAPGQIRAAAMDIAKRRADEQMRARRKLEAPKPTPEERKRSRAFMREVMENFGMRRTALADAVAEPTAEIARPAPITAVPREIDRETMRAQETILRRRSDRNGTLSEIR